MAEAEAAAEIHQLKSANEHLTAQLKEANDEIKVLTVLNQRGDAELDRLQQAVASSKDAAVRMSELQQGALHLSISACRAFKAYLRSVTHQGTKCVRYRPFLERMQRN